MTPKKIKAKAVWLVVPVGSRYSMGASGYTHAYESKRRALEEIRNSEWFPISYLPADSSAVAERDRYKRALERIAEDGEEPDATCAMRDRAIARRALRKGRR